MSIAEGAILKIASSLLLQDTQTAINVFWVELLDSVGSGPLDEDDIVAAAANWIDQLFANVEDSISDNDEGTLVEVWTVDEPTGVLTPIGDDALTWNGANVDDALPNGCAAICSMKTTSTKATGRKFIPGFAETLALDNNLIGIGITDLVLFSVDWATNYVDANDVEFNPGVYSPTQADFFPATGVVISNAIIGYQRRRKPGVGS